MRIGEGTKQALIFRHPREREEPVAVGADWVPAFAGMTNWGEKAEACAAFSRAWFGLRVRRVENRFELTM